jgi:hypothetical protein
MSPVIRISESTYELLQRLARPFVDTPDSVIQRLAEKELQGGEGVQSSNGRPRATRADEIQLDPESPGNLAHTRVRYARLGDHVIQNPNWAKLFRLAHAEALEELGSVASLRQVSRAHIREGRYESEGFSYLAGSDISVQGQDSNLSWQNSLRLAQATGLPVEVEFEWYNKEGAAHPGKAGRIQWEPVEEA